MTKSYLENKVRNSNQSQVSSLTPSTPQTHPPEDPYQSQNERNARTMDNLTNLDEDNFKKSMLTLLNGKKTCKNNLSIWCKTWHIDMNMII